MKRLCAACVKRETGPERPSPFSQLVYTDNNSYVIHHGDLRKIHKAASQGQAWKLDRMMKKTTMDLNIKDAKKRTALHWACFNGHAEVVTLLVDRKCQLDVLDGENRTPLMKALQCQREACANILIDSGADSNIVDVYGNTAVHYAVYSENLSVVVKLLSCGADIEVKNKAGHTPLLLAIRKRSEQIVEFLLTKNANANVVDKFKCIHQQLLEYKQKISKNSQNSNPEGTSEGTPEEATPLAERTPDKAEGSVEGTPDE
ncbi:putative ankyrin repeat domain-containing protein 30B-like [Piliocolobus tephrosceles]|uniref:putative ankyrin repeat domain-containing protein 30B-like n=1 Tax=Piliocolobus tephrosceles TaxID=591936 RepID=UPI000C2B2D27|nr:putative ankyrin repeat domain-containing protein 30B-like [Piliocolobus tephrosceles]